MVLIFMLFLNALHYLLSLEWWHAAVAFLSRQLKHTVLRYAHPTPRVVTVGVARASSIPGMIMSGFADQDDSVVVATMSAEGNDVRLCQIEDSNRPCGLMAAVRYVGRRGYLFPTTPENALLIDVGLDAAGSLSGVLDELERRGSSAEEKTAILPVVVYHMETLERDFHPKKIWIDGFDQRSVLDVCWAGIFRWMIANDILDSVGDDFPSLSCWWHHVRPRDNSEDYTHDDTDDSAESDGWLGEEGESVGAKEL